MASEGAGRGAEFLGTWAWAIARPPELGTSRVAGRAGPVETRGSGEDCGGAAGAERAASPEAEGAEPRSLLPPGRRAQAEVSRPRLGKHCAQTHYRQCSEAPGGATDCRVTNGEAAGPQTLGEPTTLSPDPAAFCLTNVAAQGLSQSRCGGQAGQPLPASPGVTGDRSAERVESPDLVLWVVPSVQAPRRESWGVGGVFSIHWRNARFEIGKLFLGVPGRVIDCCNGFTGLAGLAALFCVLGSALSAVSIVKGAEGQRPSGLLRPDPEVKNWGSREATFRLQLISEGYQFDEPS